jgi:hypothetical protein
MSIKITTTTVTVTTTVKTVTVTTPAPVVTEMLIVTPAPVPPGSFLGTCEDCGSELSDCCGEPTCGRIFCEYCEFGDMA